MAEAHSEPPPFFIKKHCRLIYAQYQSDNRKRNHNKCLAIRLRIWNVIEIFVINMICAGHPKRIEVQYRHCVCRIFHQMQTAVFENVYRNHQNDYRKSHEQNIFRLQNFTDFVAVFEIYHRINTAGNQRGYQRIIEYMVSQHRRIHAH